MVSPNKLENKEALAIARQNFKTWNDALQTNNPTEVARLYANDAAFLPTLSAEFKIGNDQAEGYFEHFLQKHPFGEIINEQVHALGDGYYSYSGLYNFEVGPEERREIANARFTFVYGKDELGEWKILDHQSSLVPKVDPVSN